MKQLFCNESAGFNTTKSEFLYTCFSEFCPLFRNIYFKGSILIVLSAIYFFELFVFFLKQTSKTVGILQLLQNILPRTSKLFIRTRLDQGVIKHDQVQNFFYHKKLESSQDNVSLAITGNHKGNVQGKVHQGMGPESFQLKR